MSCIHEYCRIMKNSPKPLKEGKGYDWVEEGDETLEPTQTPPRLMKGASYAGRAPRG